MNLRRFDQLAYDKPEQLVFGHAKYPVALPGGLVIGGGEVYPELNFTLPTMSLDFENQTEIMHIYREIITGAAERAVALSVPGFVAEVELLPPCTWNAGWGADLIAAVKGVLNDFSAKYGIKTALRATVIDVREGRGLENLYHGRHWDAVTASFNACAAAGADLLAIESVGGKEVHDEAVLFCDLQKAVFALGVLGVQDMRILWSEIRRIADATGTIASGDTACGFANTAMVMADRKMIPKTFAAVDRVLSAVRSLAAVEAGAAGPHKDCGYEGVYVKAITGIPISMEGRSSAVAHLSPVGNVAACMADLWSNESVQHIKLLGGYAPTVSMEQLAYDCRLLNEASRRGDTTALLLRDLHADSDSLLDPQAYVLRPDVVFAIAQKIVADQNGPLSRTLTAARAAIAALRQGLKDRRLVLDEREIHWLDLLEQQVDDVPESVDELTALMRTACDRFDPRIYAP